MLLAYEVERSTRIHNEGPLRTGSCFLFGDAVVEELALLFIQTFAAGVELLIQFPSPNSGLLLRVFTDFKVVQQHLVHVDRSGLLFSLFRPLIQRRVLIVKLCPFQCHICELYRAE